VAGGHTHVHVDTIGGRAKFRLGLSAALTIAFVIFEVLAGLIANSLALLTDAAHNLTGVGILVALINSTTLTLISAGIFYEAYERFVSPPPVAADILIAVGAAAFVVNVVTAWLVSHGAEHDLNIRSAFIHLLGDVFSTAGAVLAGIGIWFTGFYWLDPLASVLIGLLILWNIVIDDVLISQAALIQHEIKEMIRSNYGIGHCTLQLECEGCDPDSLYCDINHYGRHQHADNHHAAR
jgi:cobalt-zinc-cadmium efflux system protein